MRTKGFGLAAMALLLCASCAAPPRIRIGPQSSTTTGVNLWPLVRVQRDWQEQSRRAEVLWPFFAWRRSPRESHLQVLPFWVDHRSVERDYMVSFPLFWRGSRLKQGGRSYYLHVLPLFYSWGKDERDVRGRTMLAIPFFSLQQNFKHGGWALLTPLFGWTVKRDRGRLEGRMGIVLGLYWHTSGPTGTRNVLFPLFWQANDDTRRYLVIPPGLFWDVESKTSGRRSLGVFPFYYYYRPERTAEDRSATHSILWPLLWFRVYERGGRTEVIFWP